MLFKSLPPSHRLAIFLAVFYTGAQLIGWNYGTPLLPYPLLMLLLVWAIVFHQSLQRRYPSLQTGGTAPGQIDLLYTWFDRAPAWVRFTYWLLVILAAVLIYRFL